LLNFFLQIWRMKIQTTILLLATILHH